MTNASVQPPRQGMRALAVTSGALILTAATAAVIIKGDQDFPTALLTGAMAFGVLIGAIVVGRAWGENRFALAIAITLALVCGEAFSLFATGERIVANRAADQEKVTTKKGAHKYAWGEYSKADTALKEARTELLDAQSERTKKSAGRDCKDRCKKAVDDRVQDAKTALEKAETRYEDAGKTYKANPDPSGTGSPLADRLGWQPWAIDLLVAGLLSVAANGLATFLIAYGSHGNHGNRQQLEAPVFIGQPSATVARQPSATNKGLGNKPSSTRQQAEADVVALVAKGRRIPNQDALAMRWGVHKGTASKWLQDFDKRGIISRDRDGRSNVVALRK